MEEKKIKIRSFFERFARKYNLQDNDNIFELGYVNSLFAMKMLNYVENEFKINIENEDMDIKNFSSVNNIVRLIEKKSSNS